jgi:cytoskeletal protein RodZ
MVNSVGEKLHQARLGKHLSVEEAARVTRIRPDKLIDLEEDNYSNFPSMSYAKGFLLLYAKFLGVDVRDFADTLHTPSRVSSDDYEYLNAAASGPPPPSARRAYHFSQPRERTFLPVLVFGLLAAAIVLAIYLVVNFERLQTGPLPGTPDDLAEKKDLSSPAVSPVISALPPVAASTPAATAAPAASPALLLRNPPPALVAASPVAAPYAPTPLPAAAPTAAAPPPASPAPAGAFDPTREVRRAEPVLPTPPTHTDASSPSPPPVGSGPEISAIAPNASADTVKRVTIRPLRKTWVTIRKDVADSPPIFEDWLYPGDIPLKLRGHKFWIQVKDPASVQITRDGQPVPGGQGDIQIE